jgi:hypothetical protein
MFPVDTLHGEIDHFGFCYNADHGDGTAESWTVVDLYGPPDMVLFAAFAITAIGAPVVSDLAPHSCSAIHGCVHAALLLDGHLDYAQIKNALVGVFGPPALTSPAQFAQQRNAHLN